MENLLQNGNSVTLRASETEFSVVNNSLNTVAHGIRVPESDFTAWLGRSRSDTRDLLDRLREEVDAEALEPNSSHFVTMRLTLMDLELLRNAIVKTTNGEHISERGYHPRIGAWLEEGTQLLAELEALIMALSPGS